MDDLIVLPTYNEAENLAPLVGEIFKVVPQVHILIVDDNSPDGTGQLASQLSKGHPNQIFVHHRNKKEGLGKAYLDGFRQALKMNPKRVVQMDADFSHPPKVIPQLLKALEDHDFVLGCRYIPGGGVKNWDLKRRFLSRMGNIYAKNILRVPIHDLTGGFKGFRRSVLEFLTQCPLESTGYNFQIETTVRALHAGYSYQEIPFVFEERRKGTSKMSQDIIWEAFIKTFKLRKTIKRSQRHNLNQKNLEAENF